MAPESSYCRDQKAAGRWSAKMPAEKYAKRIPGCDGWHSGYLSDILYQPGCRMCAL
ncbi:hypothetical protein RSAG8_01857, partial [Rhizoctonia solani AG-8 WAC10335]